MPIHEFKNCRYCADDIDVSYLERHEAICKTQTDAERQSEIRKRLTSREGYRRRHGLSAATPNGNREKYRASMAVPHSDSGIKNATAICRYCKGEIGRGQLPKHEPVCRKRTPAERTRSMEAREYQRKYSRTAFEKKKTYAVALKGHGRGHSLFNGNGKRLSATISIDFKSFREVLLQLAPMLSIDKVEVL